MHRPGSNVENMEISDFLCDFCRRAWDGQFPLVEGHQGSLICGNCLSVAYTEVVLNEQNSAGASYDCALCLEEREQIGWRSPMHAESNVCLRCVKQSATKLDKDEDWAWSKPGGSGGAAEGESEEEE